MNETAEYLRGMVRRVSDTVLATVLSRNDDDSYQCALITTKAVVRAAKNNPIDEFAIGSRVELLIPSASGNVVGAQPVIVSRAPREQRGISGSDPNETERSVTAPVIVSVDPDPLILIAGGEPQTQTITGFGLTSAATYAGEDGETSPSLTNDEAPTVTPTQVVMSISADADSLLGDWHLTIGSVRAKDALRVVENSGPSPSLWALTWDAGFSVPHLLRIDPATMEVFNDYTLDTPYFCDMIRTGPHIAIRGGRGFAGSGFGVYLVDRLNGEEESAIAQGPQSFTPLGMSSDGARLFYPYITPGLAEYAIATGVETLHDLDYGTYGSLIVTAIDGVHMWATSAFGAGNRLVKLLLADLSVVADAAFTECVEMAVAPTAIYLLRDGAGTRELAKVSKADLTEVDSVEVSATPAAQKGDSQIIVKGDYVYGSVRTGGAGILFRCTLIGGMTLETLALAQVPCGVSVIGTLMFVGDDAGGVTVVNLDTWAIVDRYQFDAAQVYRVVCI